MESRGRHLAGPIGRFMLLAGVAAIGWLVITSGVAMSLYRVNADLAARIAPANAFAQSALARAELPVDPKAAAAAARAALRRDLTQASAAGTLGFFYAQDGDLPRGLALLEYSQELSRRDQQVQMWGIELAAQRGDLDEVLHHYDLALRTSATSADLLFPILAKAIADPLVKSHLATLLVGPTPWKDSFFQYLSTKSPDLRSAGSLIDAVYRRGGKVADDSRNSIMSSLIETGSPDVAWDIYARTHPSAIRVGVRNGSFDDLATDGVGPFNWQFREIASARAEIAPGAKGNVLELSAENGDGGVVAWQRLVLKPGSYRLGVTINTVEGAEVGRSTLRLTCLPTGQVLTRLLTTPGRRSASFTVPATCRSQVLEFEISSGGIDRAIDLTADDVSITRARS